MIGKRLISYRYMVLRVSTAAGTLGAGLLQTFVFARVLTPERFSLFIFFAALGYSLYLADVGIVKVLFVNLRGRFLQNKPLGAIAGQATMVFCFICRAGGFCLGRMFSNAGEPLQLLDRRQRRIDALFRIQCDQSAVGRVALFQHRNRRICSF